MNFGILVFPEVEELDFVGPWEMLSVWRLVDEGAPKPLIVAESADSVACANGLSVNPQVSFADCPPLGFLLVPGGSGTRRQVENGALVEFIEAHAGACQCVLSVCTGAFLLHRAGLLSGRRATTAWPELARLRSLGDVDVVEERVVRDGKIWSSAGVSAGMDLALELIATFAGEEVAGRVQASTEYFPSHRRYGDFHAGPEAPAYVRRSR
jgi:transcriptional regulator GlxA family with amidase domain